MASPFSLADRIRIVFHALEAGDAVALPGGHTVMLADTASGHPTLAVPLYAEPPRAEGPRTPVRFGEYAPAMTAFLEQLMQLPDETLVTLGASQILRRVSTPTQER